jgi:hypothetical protein
MLIWQFCRRKRDYVHHDRDDNDDDADNARDNDDSSCNDEVYDDDAHFDDDDPTFPEFENGIRLKKIEFGVAHTVLQARSAGSEFNKSLRGRGQGEVTALTVMRHRISFMGRTFAQHAAHVV